MLSSLQSKKAQKLFAQPNLSDLKYSILQLTDQHFLQLIAVTKQSIEKYASIEQDSKLSEWSEKPVP